MTMLGPGWRRGRRPVSMPSGGGRNPSFAVIPRKLDSGLRRDDDVGAGMAMLAPG